MEQRDNDAGMNLPPVESFISLEATKPLIDQVIERCEVIGLSESQFCKMLGIHRYSWTQLATGKQQKLDVSLLIKISHFLGIEIDETVRLYLKDAHGDEKQRLDFAKRNSFIANHFDLKNLRKIKFLDCAPTDFNATEKRIKEFFGFASIYEYQDIEVSPAYSRTKRASSDRMMQFWNTMVRFQLKNVSNPNPFDRERFKNLISMFRAATLDVEFGLSKVIRALYECGVTVIVQSYVANTSIRGGTFIIQGKPHIVLTNLYKRYPTIWQVLAHECYHVLMRLEEIRKRGYRLNSEDKDLFDSELEEEAAYEFGRKLFLDDENLPYIEKYIYAEGIVEQRAQAWHVHPSLIYNIYLDKHPEERKKYSSYLIKSDVTIKNLEVKEPWTKPNIQVPINEIKSKLNPVTVPQ